MGFEKINPVYPPPRPEPLPQKHSCPRPDLAQWQIGKGSIWVCDECGQRWVSHQYLYPRQYPLTWFGRGLGSMMAFSLTLGIFGFRDHLFSRPRSRASSALEWLVVIAFFVSPFVLDAMVRYG